ncbi:MAG: transposase, partial [Cellulosilyticum sp.]|nr:transposase [Cellulosilyticum sp.]
MKDNKERDYERTFRRIKNEIYTSQKCSKCGNVDKENRIDQATFICKECGLKINADYNASLNIA